MDNSHTSNDVEGCLQYEGPYYSSCDDDDDSIADDGPLLSHRYQKWCNSRSLSKFRRRRSAYSSVRKIFVVCAVMSSFCIVLYIPLYNRSTELVPKYFVAGWNDKANRDTKVYIQHYTPTTLINPSNVCQNETKRKLPLLIIVTSHYNHTEQRNIIRKTWADYKIYKKYEVISNKVKEKYKNYNYTYDLYVPPKNITKRNLNASPTTSKSDTKKLKSKNKNNGKKKKSVTKRTKRSVILNVLLPKIVKDLNIDSIHDNTTIANDELEDYRLIIDSKNAISEFDNNQPTNDYDYANIDYPSNVMKIPPKGFEEKQNVSAIIDILKKSYASLVVTQKSVVVDENVDFKVVFLLGMSNLNDSTIQSNIENEAAIHGDIIQENFTDTYNNLTLKSIMLLKWVVHNCDSKVRYVMKTDDDVLVNVVNLMRLLRNKTAEYEKGLKKRPRALEYLLLGDLISDAKPVTDTTNKWFTPQYMFNGRVYPKYLSGTGYVMSLPTVHSLFKATMDTPFFHLEDIYITGLCAGRSSPPIKAVDAPGMVYQEQKTPPDCAALDNITVHAVNRHVALTLPARWLNATVVDLCERKRLTIERRRRLNKKKRQIKKKGLKAKATSKENKS